MYWRTMGYGAAAILLFILLVGLFTFVRGDDGITYAESYQIARINLVDPPRFVILKSNNNPLQALGVIDGWEQIGPTFYVQENAEDYLYRIISNPDAPTYVRVAPNKYGKELQTRVVELP